MNKNNKAAVVEHFAAVSAVIAALGWIFIGEPTIIWIIEWIIRAR